MNTIHRKIALRAYTEPEEHSDHSGRKRRPRQWPKRVLIFDTETTTDPTQRLLFGSYLLGIWEDGGLRVTEVGIFHADELEEFDPDGCGILKKFVRDPSRDLHIYSRREFLDEVFRPMIRAKALVVGFNLPFDLSRLAVHAGNAMRRYYGGFSFQLWDWWNPRTEQWEENQHRPRLCVRSLDSKRAFMGLRRPAEDRFHPGRFLDLRTLAFALTNRGHSLDSACEAFGVPGGKDKVTEHGRITTDYIRYNLRDVDLTRELLVKLRHELDGHPIKLPPDKAYSPASVAKAYLREMGLRRPLQKFGAIPKQRLGQAMAAYFGGRAEIRIRRTPVPVVYVDFLSMYPTVNSLLGIWDLLIAKSLECVEATEEVRNLLSVTDLAACFEEGTWENLKFFAEIEPDGDILPVRTEYDSESRHRNIGINPLSSDDGIWFSGPDLVAAKLLSGKVPKLRKAWKLVPRGIQNGLKPVRLRNRVNLDPRNVDFFRNVIEERKSLDQTDLPQEEVERLDLFLKVLANSGSYGVFAEFNREELPESAPEMIQVHGQKESFSFETYRPESPGTFCFPPLAALTTGAARLMLAMLERCVTDLGGSYAFCDTDSMAIVSTRDGGGVECPRGRGGQIRALSWEEVRDICERFQKLSPYDADRIGPHSVLEIEDENFRDGKQRQLYAFAVSAKRYVLYEIDGQGDIRIPKFSEHGLGHLMDPTDPESDSVRWIEEVWRFLLGRETGLDPDEPQWLDRPAISRTTISSPHLYRPYREAGDDAAPYADRIKPYNFLLSAHVAMHGHPEGVDPSKFHLIAPYASDPSTWLQQPWTDVHTGQEYPVTVRCGGPSEWAELKTFRYVVDDYATHPEPKSGDPGGGVCTRDTVGLLQRVHVRALGTAYIGKESNELEAVEKGLVHDVEDVQAEYGEDRDAFWADVVVPALKEVPARVLATHVDRTERYIKMLRNGHRSPSEDDRRVLEGLALRHREASLEWDS